MKRVVESGLDAKYYDAAELVKRSEEVVPFLSKYVLEDKYWYPDEVMGESITAADSYASIAALHLMGAIASTNSLDDAFYALLRTSRGARRLADGWDGSEASIFRKQGAAEAQEVRV